MALTESQEKAKHARDTATQRAYRRTIGNTSRTERYVVEAIKPGTSYMVKSERLGSEAIYAATCDEALSKYLEGAK
jgi:hypothetical protein